MKLVMQRKCFANYPTCSFHDTIHAVIIQFLNILMQSFTYKKFITFVEWISKSLINTLRSVLMMKEWASSRAKCLEFLHQLEVFFMSSELSYKTIGKN